MGKLKLIGIAAVVIFIGYLLLSYPLIIIPLGILLGLFYLFSKILSSDARNKYKTGSW